MKSLKYMALAAAALLLVPATAATKKKNTKKDSQPAEVVDTISTRDFSYLFGKVNAAGLINYIVRMGVDTTYFADFLQGFDAGSAADPRAKARLTGQEIRQQLEMNIIARAKEEIGDSVLVPELFIAGFRAAISGENDILPLSEDSTQTVIRKQMEYYQKARMERLYGDNRRAGEAFLKENAKKKDVKVTESGLQYKVLEQGNGAIPTATQRVKVNYEGHLIDGTEFDSSYKRNEPATFACNQVIKGWTEALTMMPVGSKWELYIPQELAYGERETGGTIKPFSTLIFTVELLGIEE